MVSGSGLRVWAKVLKAIPKNPSTKTSEPKNDHKRYSVVERKGRVQKIEPFGRSPCYELLSMLAFSRAC